MTALHFLSDSTQDIILRPSTDTSDKISALRRKTLFALRCLPRLWAYSCFSHLYHSLTPNYMDKDSFVNGFFIKSSNFFKNPAI